MNSLNSKSLNNSSDESSLDESSLEKYSLEEYSLNNHVEFIHFHSEVKCNDIYEYILCIIKILNLEKIITNKCCGGKGFGFTINKDNLNFLVQKYELTKSIKNIATIDTCLFCCNTKILFFICNNDKCRKSVCSSCRNNYINMMMNAHRDLVCSYCITPIY